MPLNCDCDSLGVLPNLLDVTCPTDYDQVVRLGFQLKQATVPFNGGASDILDPADWAVLAASATATKIVFSPASATVVIPASEGSYAGENANDSVNGLGYLLGEQNVRVTGQFHSISQEAADALSELSCYSDVALGASRLTAFLFTRRVRGKSGIIAKSGAVAGEYEGIEIFNFRISSVGSEGYQAKNVYNFAFDLQPDVLQGTEKLQVTWNPLSLVNVATS